MFRKLNDVITNKMIAPKIDAIVKENVKGHQADWFNIDRNAFLDPENEGRTMIFGIRDTGFDGFIFKESFDESVVLFEVNWLLGLLGNKRFWLVDSAFNNPREIVEIDGLRAYKYIADYCLRNGYYLVVDRDPGYFSLVKINK